MRRTILISLGVAFVLAAIVVALPFVVPVDAYRSQIEQRATAATGRELRIKGPLRLTLFPELGVRAENVTLANAKGGTAPYFATMDSLRVGVRLIPLLTGHLEISHVTLNRPVIHLETDADGRGNWMLGKPAAKSASPAAAAGGGVAAAARARFAGVTISDGTVDYRDAKTGLVRTLSHINLTIGITAIDRPLTVDGDLVADGQKVSLDGKIASLQRLMDGKTSDVDLSLTSKLVQASFKGALARDGGDGTLKLDTPDLRKLAAWAGHKLKPGKGLGHLSLEGKLAAHGKIVRFAAIKLVFDKMTLTGALTLDRTHKTPFIGGKLTVDRLDLNPYLAATPQGGGQKSAPARRTGWSRAPIDFSALRLVNAKLEFNAGAIQARALKLGKTTLALSLANGTLHADLDPVTLYGGSGKAQLAVTDENHGAQIHSTLDFRNLAIKPFLNDAIGINRIEGTGAMKLNVASAGASPNAIMHALNGSGQIDFANGQVRGVNLGLVARTIQTAVSGGAISSGASTQFSQIAASFTITKGVMTTKDFRLVSPVLGMTGAGNVDLGEQSIDFVVKPKALSSMTGGAGNIGIPFRIHGPWSNIHYTPDLSGVAQGILNSVMTGGVSSKSVLQGVLGGMGGQQPKKASPPKKNAPNPLDMMKGLFGGGG